jgi:hypothetical protein
VPVFLRVEDDGFRKEVIADFFQEPQGRGKKRVVEKFL